MANVFYSPRRVIDFFTERIPLLYTVVPLLANILVGVAFSVYNYTNDISLPVLHILARVLDIPYSQYAIIQIFLFPFVHIVDFFLYWAILIGLVRIFRLDQIDPFKASLFFAFFRNTISLVWFPLVEQVGLRLMPAALNILQPLLFVVLACYPMEYIHQQADIGRWKALGMHGIPLMGFLGFRVIFI